MFQKLTSQPLWQVGFRPFFALACLAGASLPVVWLLLFFGRLPAPMQSFSIMQWHAHEMFFGFGWAVIGGFLLTATKNWVQIRGFHGGALLFLAFAWVIERLGMWFEASLSPLLFQASNNLFLMSIVAMLVWTLVRHRKTDSYRDNYFFLIVLPTFLVAKNLMLSTEYFVVGASMALGLFRMAFLVMLERTLTQFMKSAFQVEILRNPLLDRLIKLLGVAMVFEQTLPSALSGALAFALALLLAGRFAFWMPHLAMRRIDIGIMYLGYLAIVAQLLMIAGAVSFHPSWVGGVVTHVFTFGAMGFIIPAMLIRISKGHTGRKVCFDAGDKAVLWLMILAFLARVVAPQWLTSVYPECLVVAATCWFLAFSTLGWRYIPYLMQPRVDGKEH